MFFFLFKQKTAYEMRISDWSSDVCSSDLFRPLKLAPDHPAGQQQDLDDQQKRATNGFCSGHDGPLLNAAPPGHRTRQAYGHTHGGTTRALRAGRAMVCGYRDHRLWSRAWRSQLAARTEDSEIMVSTVQSPAATLRAAWLAQAPANPWITFGLAATAVAVPLLLVACNANPLQCTASGAVHTPPR